MRLATYEHRGVVSAGVVSAGVVSAGVVSEDHLYPLADGVTVLDLVRSGLPAAIGAGAAALSEPPGPALSEVRLRAPLAPPTVRDFVAFEEHVEGVILAMSDDAVIGPEWYEYPTFYFTNPYAIVGPDDDVAVPPGCRLLDFELEVGAVIGLGGSDIAPADAWKHIFGFTIFNDWSARDLQGREMRVNLGPAKGKDSATTLGPWLVTADEMESHLDSEGFLALGMTAQLNGVEVGRDLLSNMGWPFADLVAYASRGTEVRAGDVLGSGTCGNGGCLAELWGRRGRQDPPSLQPGDTVTLWVEGIGTLANTVVAGRSPVPVGAARVRPRNRP